MATKNVSRPTRSRVSRPAPTAPLAPHAAVLEAAHERLSAVSTELQAVAASAPADVRAGLHAALAALAAATSRVSSALSLYEAGR